jgi:hypothetical protein
MFAVSSIIASALRCAYLRQKVIGHKITVSDIRLPIFPISSIFLLFQAALSNRQVTGSMPVDLNSWLTMASPLKPIPGCRRLNHPQTAASYVQFSDV